MNTFDLKIRLWGVRGSYPVPGHKTMKYGGNTSCIEVRTGNHIIILDAGTGLIGLGQQLSKEFIENDSHLDLVLLLTHTHLDHIQGLPFFAPASTCKYPPCSRDAPSSSAF